MTTPLARILADKILKEGPISLETFMGEALGHPVHGYYRTRDPLGKGGDFVTAPEISQIFGELIGLFCAVLWQQMGCPSVLHLIELGPGRGTLMKDALRAAQSVPSFFSTLRPHLVETSPILRQAQKNSLADFQCSPTWHESLDYVPEGPFIIIANEFFDALPIRQAVKRGDEWRERCVGLDENGAFVFIDGTGLEIEKSAQEGDIFEFCPQAIEIVEAVNQRLSSQRGALLVIDYGHARPSFGDSLQAVRTHAFHAPLADIGDADITAHVDFQALAQAASLDIAQVYGPLAQGLWLLRLGGEARLNALSAASPDRAEDLTSGFQRLVDPRQMGALFKVLCIAHRDLPTPPGF